VLIVHRANGTANDPSSVESLAHQCATMQFAEIHDA
jgi:hypothetical protein